RRFELVGLGDEPFSQLATVADAFDSHALPVDPKIAAHGGADAVENVLALVSVLVAEDRIGEFLAVSGRAAVVDVEDRIAMCGENLIAEVEGRAVLSVRAAVNVDD